MVTGAGLVEIDLVNKTIKLVDPEMGGGWGPMGKMFDLYQSTKGVKEFDGVNKEITKAIISRTATIMKTISNRNEIT